MTVKVVYYSTTGNTKKIALAVAQALRATAQKAIVDGSKVSADILFLGGAVYATQGHGIHRTLRKFISTLDPSKVRGAALFGTGFADSQAIAQMAELLKARGIRVHRRSFFCKGRFLFLMAGHPDPVDQENAAEWARQVCGLA